MDDGVIVLQLCSWKSRDRFQRIKRLCGKATSLIRAGFLDVVSVVCKKVEMYLRLSGDFGLSDQKRAKCASSRLFT